MKYTKEIPTKPGWYWVRYRGALINGKIYNLYKFGNGLSFTREGERWPVNHRFEYAGPIEEPEE